MTLHFVGQEHEAENVETFIFQPASAFLFQAGQYLRYTLPHSDPDTRGVSRTFTIASAPSEPRLRLTTRVDALSSTFKRALTGLTPGAALEATGPFGQFVFGDTQAPAVLIAGGIGITPFRAILADLAARHIRASTTLLYSNASADIPFRGFLDSLARDWPELHLVYTVTRPTPEWQGPSGRIGLEFIQRHVPAASQSVYFVCGPTALVESTRATLADMGVDAGRIKHEGFPGYQSVGASRPSQ